MPLVRTIVDACLVLFPRHVQNCFNKILGHSPVKQHKMRTGGECLLVSYSERLYLLMLMLLLLLLLLVVVAVVVVVF